jgi:hypothetical protein
MSQGLRRQLTVDWRPEVPRVYPVAVLAQHGRQHGAYARRTPDASRA